MKKKVWENKNHMKFESQHKAFNKNVDCISTGNVIGNVQRSGYIRAYNNTECNGKKDYLKGELQNFDLNSFRNLRIPHYIEEEVRRYTQDTSTILYCFFYWNEDVRYIQGYVLTTTENKLIRTWYGGKTWKSQTVIDEAILYITQ